MKKLIILLSSVLLSVPPIITTTSLTRNNLRSTKSVFKEYEVDSKHYDDILKSTIINVENYDFESLHEILSNGIEPMFGFYSELSYNNYMNTFYQLMNNLNKLITSETQVSEFNELNFNLGQANQMIQTKLDQEDYINEIKSRNSEVSEYANLNYYAFNILYSELISEDIEKYKDSKTELAGLKAEVSVYEASVDDLKAGLSNLDIGIQAGKNVEKIFDNILAMIHERIDYIKGFFAGNSEIWIEILHDGMWSALDQLVRYAVNQIPGLDYDEVLANVKEQFLNADVEFEDFKDIYEAFTSAINGDEEIIVPDATNNIATFLDNMTKDVVKDLFSDKIGEYISEQLPIIKVIENIVDIGLAILAVEMDMFTNLHNHSNFLDSFIMNDLPNMFSIIEDEFKNDDSIEAQMILRKITAFTADIRNVISSFRFQFIDLKKIDLVKKAFDLVTGIKEETKKWFKDVAVAAGMLDKPIALLYEMKENTVKKIAQLENDKSNLLNDADDFIKKIAESLEKLMI
ncbi:hypothetical protein SCLARK_00531 [Spiroplasma clarkii]|uniref:hypothetical protein n=1 Tax=Spiroplasma clarkii TaxID=2139 RepID=UPI000B5826E8|nr:hypothetical protein [Spiroplasma clarkii]ARU91219.1 hypothetical protein SCLARK_00531 [Spiroplasma clarkii]